MQHWGLTGMLHWLLINEWGLGNSSRLETLLRRKQRSLEKMCSVDYVFLYELIQRHWFNTSLFINLFSYKHSIFNILNDMITLSLIKSYGTPSRRMCTSWFIMAVLHSTSHGGSPKPHRPTDLYPFYLHGLILIPAWISNHMLSKVWDEITYPFLYFNGCTVEV